jgi:hypothetical protein
MEEVQKINIDDIESLKLRRAFRKLVTQQKEEMTKVFPLMLWHEKKF